MNAIETVKRQGYADGLAGKSVPRFIWTDLSEFGRAYSDAWMAGALAATAPAPRPTPTPSSIVARAF